MTQVVREGVGVTPTPQAQAEEENEGCVYVHAETSKTLFIILLDSYLQRLGEQFETPAADEVQF